MHPLAVDLNLDNDVVEEVDDPMAYFYNVRLITETDPDGDEDPAVGRVEYASSSSNKGNDREGAENGKLEEEAEAKWGGSVMEVKADQLSYVLSPLEHVPLSCQNERRGDDTSRVGES